MTELTFCQVQPLDIHHHWPFILSALQKLKAVGDGGWICEDVYAAIVNQRCECFLIRRDRDEGFFAGYPRRRNYDGLSEYMVWMLWCDSTRRTAAEKNAVVQFVDSRARYHGCKRIIGESPRMGFKKFGYKVIHHCFVKNLD